MLKILSGPLNLGRSGGLQVARSAGPISVAPFLWFKADAITGLADGASVASWLDSSGNNRVATQATGANKPTYKLSNASLNNKPSVTFNGTSSYLTTAAFASALVQPYTLFIVVKRAQVAAADQFTDGLVTGNRCATGSWNGAGTEDLFAGTGLTPVTTNTTASRVFSYVVNGASSAIYRDGGAALASGDAGSVSLTGLTIGTRFSVNSNWLSGDIAEILLYPGALSTANRQAVQGSLGTKYAITVT